MRACSVSIVDLEDRPFPRRTLRYILDQCWPATAKIVCSAGAGSPRTFSPAAAFLLYAGVAMHEGGLNRRSVLRFMTGLWQQREVLTDVVTGQIRQATAYCNIHGQVLIGSESRLPTGLHGDPRKAIAWSQLSLAGVAKLLPASVRRQIREGARTTTS